MVLFSYIGQHGAPERPTYDTRQNQNITLMADLSSRGLVRKSPLACILFSVCFRMYSEVMDSVFGTLHTHPMIFALMHTPSTFTRITGFLQPSVITTHIIPHNDMYSPIPVLYHEIC